MGTASVEAGESLNYDGYGAFKEIGNKICRLVTLGIAARNCTKIYV